MKIDYVKFAELAGFKTPASANASFLLVKKKLLAGAEPGCAAKSAPKKGKADAVTESDSNAEPGTVADDEGSQPASPQKKPSRKKAASTNGASTVDVKMEDGEDNQNEDTAAAAPAKRSYKRKPKDPNAPPSKRGKKAAKTDDAVEKNHTAAEERHEEHQSIFGPNDEAGIKTEDGEDELGNGQTAAAEEEALNIA